ncbi:TetR/AcrR family transcriptional regulator [Desulforamulus ruminis]|uniref:Regulatory protein TetR n=1 Tax=Desulforamulus ruminis (strain ATCC 23193 / DSM 2154 / NCIMB 8452 / DL) TaxID=696281 RepID=F6DSV9_DESRL|nr:TetR/AcrR family transcriptional regulator [Desulforamulus ruminis]AEG59953.1 regulatory protein TetR [Desulforamulus ruminis DSM 2154]
MGDQPSFIAEARREQIIKASIETLDEIGYVNVSLAKIAKRANVSTGLISYHFLDKEDLLNNTLAYLLKKQLDYIQERISKEESAYDKLISFIDASLAYQGTHRVDNIALIEIIFNARTPDNVPYYKVSSQEEDPLYKKLQEILCLGQETKEFAKFDSKSVSIIIQGAIAESMLMNGEGFDLEAYREELVNMVTKMVK